MSECLYLGPCRGVRVHVTVETFDGPRPTTTTLRVCRHPALQRDGKPTSCLPDWPGPWGEHQGAMAAAVRLCHGCERRET